GAGGQHACLVADALGMTKVLIHPFSSLLSAYGMGLADIRATREQAIEEPLDDPILQSIERVRAQLDPITTQELQQQGVSIDKITGEGRAHLRYAGTDTAIPVPAYHLVRKVKQSVVDRAAQPMPGGGWMINESDLVKPSEDGNPTTEPMLLG